MRRLRSDDSSSLTVQLAPPPPTSEDARRFNVPYPAIHWLNGDILLEIFDWYRLDEKNGWNVRLGWCKLSHVCQRWRHLIYECSSYLDIQIECTTGATIVDSLDHLPPLPLIVNYRSTIGRTEQDELAIYHALRLHGRVRHIELRVSLSPSIMHKALALMDGNFPILEHLYLHYLSDPPSPDGGHRLPGPLTLPGAFLAPNLRHLTLIGLGLPNGLQLLTSTASLVKLMLSNIQTSDYFRPTLLVARLQFLPLLEELTIAFSIPIPRPGTESALLGENGAPITLPSLKFLRFHGAGAYLESLAAQIRVPLLERLSIGLCNQIAFAPPHLPYLINITKVFKFSSATVMFHHNEVSVSMNHDHGIVQFRVSCTPLYRQINFAAQICDTIIPMLSGIEKLSLRFGAQQEHPWMVTSARWLDFLRRFVGVKLLCVDDTFFEELSWAMRADEVRSDPGFLPNLQCVNVKGKLFTTLRIVGRPVQFRPW